VVSLITTETVSTNDAENLLRVKDDQQQAFLLPWFYFFSGGNWAAYPTARLCGGSAAPLCLHYLVLLACGCFHAAFGFFASAQWVLGKRTDAYLN